MTTNTSLATRAVAKSPARRGNQSLAKRDNRFATTPARPTTNQQVDTDDCWWERYELLIQMYRQLHDSYIQSMGRCNRLIREINGYPSDPNLEKYAQNRAIVFPRRNLQSNAAQS